MSGPVLDLSFESSKISPTKFAVLRGCPMGPLSINCAGNILISVSNFYTLELQVIPKIHGYTTYVIEVIDLTTNIVVSSTTGYPCRPTTLKFSGVLVAGSLLGIRISPVATACVTGNISANPIQYANILELAVDTNFDESIRKVNYIISKPSNLPYPAPTFPAQYPPVPPAVPWNSIVIPWRSNQVAIPSTSSFSNTNYYLKHQSVPYSIYFYLGLNAASISAKSPELTIFLKNFQDRGDRNLLKKVYMVALTGYVMPYYAEAIDDMCNEVYTKITILKEPAISSFKSSCIKFFLRMHLGVDKYPEFVLEYFRKLSDIIGFGDPNRPGRDADYLYGAAVVDQVKTYVADRYYIVRQDQNKSCIVYWWGVAGLPLESLLIEAVHNWIAFLQYSNTFFRAITDKIWATDGLATYGLPPGTTTAPPFWYPRAPVPIYVAGAAGPVDFFKKMTLATNDSDQLNVVREMYRILAPNTNAFSAEQNDPTVPINPPVQARHIWQQIMILNQPGSQPGQKSVGYFHYDVGKYASFNTTGIIQTPPAAFNPVATENFNPQDFFEISTTDNNPVYDDGTVLVRNNTLTGPVDTVPVFPTPVYMHFGVGYRRCAGEILNYFVGLKMLKKFANVDWEVRPLVSLPALTEYQTLAPYTAVLNNIYCKSSIF